MEPQLRRPGSTGTGIPFDPFDPFAVEDKPARPPEPVDEATDAAKSTGAAAFKKGSGRGRRRVDPPVE